MLARWLPISDYGGYSFALSIFMLINAAQQALFLEPMSVLGASRYADCQREYVAVLRGINTVFGIVSGLLLAGLALGAHLLHSPGGVAETFGALALAVPGLLSFGLIRNACYLEFEPRPAAISSFGYCVLSLAGAWALNFVGWISAGSALLWTGVAAWGGILLLRWQSKARAVPVRAPGRREVWREHWRYGRWALTATPIMWIPENIAYAFASAFLGIPQAGVLRAMMNFVLPATQLTTSLTRLLNPYVAGKALREGSRGTKASLSKIVLLFASMGIVYAAVLVLFHSQAFHLLYGKRFGDSADLVAWMGGVTFFYLVLYAPMVGLRAIQSPASILVAYSGAAVVAVAAGFPLTARYGLHGTIVSLCATNAVGAAIAAWLFLRKTKNTEKQ